MLSVIKSRKSVRRWKDQPIGNADLRELLEAAMCAPSAGDERAWAFIAMDRKETLEAYAQTSRNIAIIRNASAAILICRDVSAEKYANLSIYDCSAATENILLAAHSKGLGAVWGHVFPESVDAVRELLKLPEHIVPFAVVPIGVPAETPKAVDRYDEKKTHWNQW